jgi:hypothetical protein
VWELKPEADFDTDKDIVFGLLEQKLAEYGMLVTEKERKNYG